MECVPIITRFICYNGTWVKWTHIMQYVWSTIFTISSDWLPYWLILGRITKDSNVSTLSLDRWLFWIFEALLKSYNTVNSCGYWCNEKLSFPIKTLTPLTVQGHMYDTYCYFCHSIAYKPRIHCSYSTQSKVHGANMGPPGSCRPQMGPILAPWTLLSGYIFVNGIECNT